MIGTILSAVAGPVIKGMFGAIDELVEDKDLANKLKHTLQTKILDIMETEIKSAASIIRAEINSDSYLAQNWRPLTMLVFVVIIANNYILYPYLQLFFDTGAKLDIPPDMWGLLKIGLGGYVVGRSVEKGVKVWKES